MRFVILLLLISNSIIGLTNNNMTKIFIHYNSSVDKEFQKLNPSIFTNESFNYFLIKDSLLLLEIRNSVFSSEVDKTKSKEILKDFSKNDVGENIISCLKENQVESANVKWHLYSEQNRLLNTRSAYFQGWSDPSYIVIDMPCQYDTNGNLLNYGKYNYEYDSVGRLKQLKKSCFNQNYTQVKQFYYKDSIIEILTYNFDCHENCKLEIKEQYYIENNNVLYVDLPNTNSEKLRMLVSYSELGLIDRLEYCVLNKDKCQIKGRLDLEVEINGELLIENAEELNQIVLEEIIDGFHVIINNFR